MKILRSVFVVLAIGALVGLVAQEAGAQKKKKGSAGKVTALEIKDGVGTITVLVKSKDNKEGKEMKFKITKDTKVLKAPKEKGEKPTAAAVADLAKDQFAIIAHEPDSDVATSVMIGSGKKKAAN